jgi:hypothetical protein
MGTGSPTILRVETESAPEESSAKRLAATVYDAHGGSRSPLLDGPWWLGITTALALAVLVFGDSPWKWLAAPVAVALFWLPLGIRWAVALRRSVSAFREGYQS